MNPAHVDSVPRGALLTAGVLVALTLIATGTARALHLPPAASPELLRAQEKVAPVATRNLRFTDRADGAVVIEDSDSRRVASVIEPGGETGFIRGVMRGLARDRRMRGLGDRPPFALTLWRDGELSLTDSATGRTIELNAFGGTNRAAFAVLLADRGAAR